MESHEKDAYLDFLNNKQYHCQVVGHVKRKIKHTSPFGVRRAVKGARFLGVHLDP